MAPLKELTESMCVKSLATFAGDILLVAQPTSKSRLAATRDDRHRVIRRLVNVTSIARDMPGLLVNSLEISADRERIS
jgi:hypothetical protein